MIIVGWSIQRFDVSFVQDGLYLKVETRQINNFVRASWKRALAQLGKVCCRHIGCTIESKTVEEALEHYLNCPMAPKKVSTALCPWGRCWRFQILDELITVHFYIG